MFRLLPERNLLKKNESGKYKIIKPYPENQGSLVLYLDLSSIQAKVMFQLYDKLGFSEICAVNEFGEPL